MGLGPPPRELTLIDWGRPYGKLPSEFTAEDYSWMALAERLEGIRRLNTLWENPETARRLPRDAVFYIVELRKQVKALLEDLNGHKG